MNESNQQQQAGISEIDSSSSSTLVFAPICIYYCVSVYLALYSYLSLYSYLYLYLYWYWYWYWYSYSYWYSYWYWYSYSYSYSYSYLCDCDCDCDCVVANILFGGDSVNIVSSWWQCFCVWVSRQFESNQIKINRINNKQDQRKINSSSKINTL